MPRPPPDPAPQFARAIVVTATAALSTSQFFRAASWVNGHSVRFAFVVSVSAVVFLLYLRFTLGGRGILHYPSLLIPTLQTLLCLLAALPFGITAGLASIPVAAFLLSGRQGRFLAACTVFLVTGVDVAQAASARDVADLALATTIGGGLLYGLTRLASLVSTVNAARLSLAAAAVAAERLRISESIRRTLVGNLAEMRSLAESGKAEPLVTVARQSFADARVAATDLRSLSLAPEIASARALLTPARISTSVWVGHAEPLGDPGIVLATVLREAVTDVIRRGTARHCEISTTEGAGRVMLRVRNDGARTADQSIDVLSPLAKQVSAAGGRFAAGLDPSGWFTIEASVAATPREPAVPTDPEYRLVLSLFGIALIALCARAILYLPGIWYPEAIACLAVVCALQLHFSLRDAQRGGGWGLAIMAVLAFVPLDTFGRNWIGVAGFLVGSLAMTLPVRTAVPLSGAAVALAGAMTGLHSGSTSAGIDASISVLVTGLLVYGLLRLARILRELYEADEILARDASVQERLRVARDLHDLLGHNLAGILIKGELAVRLAERDPGRAAAELSEIAALTHDAQAELGTVLGGPAELTFQSELSAAVPILKAADIATEIETSTAPLPAETSAALGVVMREAVTNLLRHSSAAHCRITLAITADSVRLEVANDGLSGEVTPPGSGIGNLNVRLAELGGTLTAGPDDGWYLLCAEL
jgi:signal transduction histidine kinase